MLILLPHLEHSQSMKVCALTRYCPCGGTLWAANERLGSRSFEGGYCIYTVVHFTPIALFAPKSRSCTRRPDPRMPQGYRRLRLSDANIMVLRQEAIEIMNG